MDYFAIVNIKNYDKNINKIISSYSNDLNKWRYLKTGITNGYLRRHISVYGTHNFRVFHDELLFDLYMKKYRNYINFFIFSEYPNLNEKYIEYIIDNYDKILVGYFFGH